LRVKEKWLKFEVTHLTGSQWQRLKDLRIQALQDSPGIHGDLAEESSQQAQYWQTLIAAQSWGAVSAAGVDVGLVCAMPATIDRYGDCWIKSWWLAPDARGLGGSAAVLDWIDQLCRLNNWKTQALGVFESNPSAIRTFERLGFNSVGIRNQSSRDPTEYYIVLARELVIA
jgi:RimJ/RimL family protein N-acetyltransferase